MKSYLNLIILSIIFSCQNIETKENFKSPDDLISVIKNRKEISPEILISDSVNLVKPFRVHLYEDYLLINDKTDDYIYSVYNIKNKKFMGRFIKRGRGPNEHLFTYLSFYSKDTIGVLDENKSTISLFSLRDIENLFEVPASILNLNKEKNFYKRFYNLNNEILLSGQFENNRYKTLNKYNNKITSFGDYPDVISKVEYSNYHLGFIFSQSEDIFVNQDFTHFASIVPGSLNLYKSDSEHFKLYKSIQWQIDKIETATYKNGKPYVIRAGKGLKVGAGNITGNNDLLFFPFSSDYIFDLASRSQYNYFDNIIVANWEGELIQLLKLKNRIQHSLVLDEKRKLLYCISIDNNTGLSNIQKIDISFLL